MPSVVEAAVVVAVIVSVGVLFVRGWSAKLLCVFPDRLAAPALIPLALVASTMLANQITLRAVAEITCAGFFLWANRARLQHGYQAVALECAVLGMILNAVASLGGAPIVAMAPTTDTLSTGDVLLIAAFPLLVAWIMLDAVRPAVPEVAIVSAPATVRERSADVACRGGAPSPVLLRNPGHQPAPKHWNEVGRSKVASLNATSTGAPALLHRCACGSTAHPPTVHPDRASMSSTS